ncbi:MAG: terpene cyclase/mutase family protein [Planctomycetes bacterium]|nr:terpene cyclase/mutase family protein [Planctomycetota bacterium]
MPRNRTTLALTCAAFAGFMLTACVSHKETPPDPCGGGAGSTTCGGSNKDNTPPDKVDHSNTGTGTTIGHELPEPGPIDPFMVKGIDYLVAAQHEDGGWGGGSHAHQDIKDPHAVKTDPGSTSFAAMALMRAGSTPFSGKHADSVLKATKYIVAAVEEAGEDGPYITDIRGTQLQTKLGQIIDTSMTSQFLARVLPLTEPDAVLQARVERALDKCIKKIEKSQGEDGGWTTQGWAPVLQSSMNNQALELAQVAGRDVDDKVIERSREYQRRDVDADTGVVGGVKSSAAAGVGFYAGAATQRATAKDATEAEKAVEEAKKNGDLPADATVSTATLEKLGYAKDEAENKATAWKQNGTLVKRLDDPNYLSGFGNNGGEEFISYMMSSESIVITGGDTWSKWNEKMHTMFNKIQNTDGSWSGQHCITSPVICTAAAILCLTADRDVHVLLDTSPLASVKEDKKAKDN